MEFVLFVVFESSLGGGGSSLYSFFLLSLSLEVSFVLLAFVLLKAGISVMGPFQVSVIAIKLVFGDSEGCGHVSIFFTCSA